ncbi:hypothetical protein K7X08_018481 [Anisodus acutangulus]|uniref:Uncharacterized protein n=1 Tax=Anisodus acutangulus TaxID=402998 RepID=A0A9Q1M0H6_9SOLA|nr:hypothetical protein K7X08_018481 [Anisodus acutangulus]
MSFKSIVHNLREMKDGTGAERKNWSTRTQSQVVPHAISESIEQGQWANLPPKSWRKITKEIVKTPEECGRLTFPISLKQPGPCESPIQCFIKRDKANSVYRLYFGMTPSYSNDQQVVDYVAAIAPFLCLSIVTDSLQAVISGIARGSGWQIIGAYVNLGAFYLVGISIAAVLCFLVNL